MKRSYRCHRMYIVLTVCSVNRMSCISDRYIGGIVDATRRHPDGALGRSAVVTRGMKRNGSVDNGSETSGRRDGETVRAP
jgi:hypothetical protein